MPRFFNPSTVAAPASNYSHGAEHFLSGRRLVISGQVGQRLDGTIPEGLEEQMEAAWDNLIAVLRAGEMTVNDLVKTIIYVTVPGSIGLARTVRAAKLGGHAPASTYLEVAGLARPEFLVEIEGEAVKEQADDGHAPASTYLEVAGLARPEFLVETAGEAVKE